ncbi:MAG: tRNA (N6-threonylcarbamoyladenosine(37)-N6)-methyltransferase TrmO [Deltaproteobacteria bacterium]|nr:tRNA (N6-threonylcarbamoyladenosine(37)-N6)-methyltransferase TrmO [Nannocystaceae bacterium]
MNDAASPSAPELAGTRGATGYSFDPIAIVRSPFGDPFGIPRQAQLARVRARVELDPRRITAESLRGLEGVTHIWLLWVFDRSDPAHSHPTVRPPRLGGNTRIGVLATRSPQRPNPIGMSAVRLVGIEGLVLHVEGCDLADGTPVLDIKPYVASCDRIDDSAVAWLADTDESRLEVVWTPAARAQLGARPDAEALALQLDEILALDPRPSYRKGDGDRGYAMVFAGREVRFRVEGTRLLITAFDPHHADEPTTGG